MIKHLLKYFHIQHCCMQMNYLEIRMDLLRFRTYTYTLLYIDKFKILLTKSVLKDQLNKCSIS